jgi:hypothetical protein
VLFLHGEFDNQTPVCYPRAIELVNRNSWKKLNLRFTYFANAGHALDPRDNIDDLAFKVVPQSTLSKIANEIADFM